MSTLPSKNRFTKAELRTARVVWDSLADNVKDEWNPDRTDYIEELLFEAQTRIDIERALKLTIHRRKEGKVPSFFGPPVKQS